MHMDSRWGGDFAELRRLLRGWAEAEAARHLDSAHNESHEASPREATADLRRRHCLWMSRGRQLTLAAARNEEGEELGVQESLTSWTRCWSERFAAVPVGQEAMCAWLRHAAPPAEGVDDVDFSELTLIPRSGWCHLHCLACSGPARHHFPARRHGGSDRGRDASKLAQRYFDGSPPQGLRRQG